MQERYFGFLLQGQLILPVSMQVHLVYMYSRNRLERPRHWPEKCGLLKRVVWWQSVELKHNTFLYEYLVPQSRSTLMAMVSQDRCHCIHYSSSRNAVFPLQELVIENSIVREESPLLPPTDSPKHVREAKAISFCGALKIPVSKLSCRARLYLQ